MAVDSFAISVIWEVALWKLSRSEESVGSLKGSLEAGWVLTENLKVTVATSQITEFMDYLYIQWNCLHGT